MKIKDLIKELIEHDMDMTIGFITEDKETGDFIEFSIDSLYFSKDGTQLFLSDRENEI